ncbi:MAG TPA: retropepsin-like aspartic protease [Bacteroidales bacterium]|nr:retropepsin-like aspartic protease [Bacteroidales bacterium]HQH18035.1 retropepsin-like aspartic protease [Bacteroidales bacterium]
MNVFSYLYFFLCMIINIPLKAISIDEEGFHLFVKIKINGKSANMLLDTGASKTVFDINRISHFLKNKTDSFESFDKLSTGLGTSTMQSSFTLLKEIKLDHLKLKNYTAILLDMKHVNQSYEMIKLKPIEGVIGSDLLMKYNAVIDYQKKNLKLRIATSDLQ